MFAEMQGGWKKEQGSTPAWNYIQKGNDTDRLLAKEIAAKESPEDTDTNDSVVVDNDVTMLESRATLPTSDRNSCWSSIEKPMDIA